MPFYQNLFDQEFRGNLPLGGQRLDIVYKVLANPNGGDPKLALNAEPYNFSATTDANLTIRYSLDKDFRYFHTLDISLTSLTKASEVVNELNSDATFATHWEASVHSMPNGKTVKVQAKKSRDRIRWYCENVGAEEALGFNANASVEELPSYFDRHIVNKSAASEYSKAGATEQLVKLAPGAAAELAIIRDRVSNSSWSASDLKDDWELLEGKSGLFHFQKNTLDGAGRITTKIEYPAGAGAGDLSKKTVYTYSGTLTNPVSIWEMVYTLSSGDLITPP